MVKNFGRVDLESSDIDHDYREVIVPAFVYESKRRSGGSNLNVETQQGHEWKHGVHIKSNVRNVEHYTWISLFGGLQGGAKGGGVLVRGGGVSRRDEGGSRKWRGGGARAVIKVGRVVRPRRMWTTVRWGAALIPMVIVTRALLSFLFPLQLKHVGQYS